MGDKYYQKRLKRAKEKKAHPDFIADMEFLSQIDGSYNRKQKAIAFGHHEIIRYVNHNH